MVIEAEPSIFVPPPFTVTVFVELFVLIIYVLPAHDVAAGRVIVNPPPEESAMITVAPEDSVDAAVIPLVLMVRFPSTNRVPSISRCFWVTAV